jgi:tetratricopeptide (TPR) repeat protein
MTSPPTPAPVDGATADRDAVYERAAQPAAAVHLPDLERPWLGLESFSEPTSAYFFGRNAEIDEIHLRLRSHPLLVLYGRSGLGKTSILKAGLIPRLRAEGKHPLLNRLRYDDPALDPAGQIVAAVFGWGDTAETLGPARPQTKSLPWTRRLAADLQLPLADDYASRLWLRLHYRGEPPDITHLILDQFEEVFTLGAHVDGAEQRVRDALAILLQGAIPAAISELIAEHDTFLDHFDPDSVPVRVILALRDDHVYALNRWQTHLPALGQNNFELAPLKGPAALDAVFKPGELRCHYRQDISEAGRGETGLPPIVDPDTAQRIVRFIARKSPGVAMAQIEAVPPILSLLCRELNERRLAGAGPQGQPSPTQISFTESGSDIQTIIAAFYERCVARYPEAVRIFIEEELVGYSGARLAQDEGSILRVFEGGCEIPGAPDDLRAAGFGDVEAARACVEDLVHQRLLSPLVEKRYELVHDLVAAVAERSRTTRAERLEKEAATRRAEQQREAKEAAEAMARRSRRQFRFAAAACLLALGAAALSFLLYQQAKAARERATRARGDAEKLIEFMTFDLRDKLMPLGKVSLLDEISQRVQAYYDSVAGEDESPDSLRRRSVMLDNRGLVLSAQGDLAGALKSHADSRAIVEKLARTDPDNGEWQHDLLLSHYYIGSVQSEMGDLAEALQSHRQGLAIAEKMAEREPEETRWQGALANGYANVGYVLQVQDDLAKALESYRSSLAIHERLRQRDPESTEWRRLLSQNYKDVGDALRRQDDLAGAHTNFQQALNLAESLFQQEPGNAVWESDLADRLYNLAEVLRARGDLSEGLRRSRESLAIAERLAKTDPANAGWQGDLALYRWQTAVAWREAEPQARSQARALLEQARDTLSELQTRTGLSVVQQQWLDSIEMEISDSK